jgi:F-type H+-transporting ATPase subunit delta
VVIRGYPKRYAQAVFEIALETNELEKWQADLKVMSSLSDDAALLILLESPRLSFDDKVKMVDEHLPGIGPMARNLAYLLIVRGRINLINQIMNRYNQLLDEYRGIRHAVVTTAIPLEDTDKNKVEKELSAILGSKLVVDTNVDPSIIGGLVARIDGKLLEGSTRYKLLALKKQLER